MRDRMDERYGQGHGREYVQHAWSQPVICRTTYASTRDTRCPRGGAPQAGRRRSRGSLGLRLT
jgi:hypothetical protein